MDLMNGLQRVNLTAMRLATLIWLAGIACCVPGMAAEPQQKEQTAAEKADRPRQQEISFQCIAPVPGLPVPMDLTQADGIRLNALDVTVSLKQHQAFPHLHLRAGYSQGNQGENHFRRRAVPVRTA